MRVISSKLSRRTKWAIALVGLAAGVSAFGIALAASPAVTAPTITSHPNDPTNQTGATFTFTDAQAGLTFQCQLDSGGYAACSPSGITYTSVSAGTHTFRVQAISGNKVSTTASFTWYVDLTPPTASITFPVEGVTYSSTAWKEGCTTTGICGKAKDARGVASVSVSIRGPGGMWWNGASFASASEKFNSATMESPGASNSEWSYPLAPPPNGSYTVHVRALDTAGNETPAGSQASTTFTIDATSPPAPTITSAPEAETGSKTATFAFSDGKPGVTFKCAKDKGTLAVCTSPKTYENVTVGEHSFSVEAIDVAGNVSSASSFSWIVVHPIAVEGNLAGQLSPGVSQPLPLTISNPNANAIHVTSLTVTAREHSSKVGCDGPANLQITQSTFSEGHSLTVPGKGAVTLPQAGFPAPQVLMLNLPTNQDACKGATFTFDYSASGHS